VIDTNNDIAVLTRLEGLVGTYDYLQHQHHAETQAADDPEVRREIQLIQQYKNELENLRRSGMRR